MSTWEDRMSQRSAARERKRQEAEREAEQDEHAGHHTHLIGTTVECSCGADFGVTCVAYPEEWWTMTPTQQTAWEESLTCRICGKRGMVTTSPTPG